MTINKLMIIKPLQLNFRKNLKNYQKPNNFKSDQSMRGSKKQKNRTIINSNKSANLSKLSPTIATTVVFG